MDLREKVVSQSQNSERKKVQRKLDKYEQKIDDYADELITAARYRDGDEILRIASAFRYNWESLINVLTEAHERGMLDDLFVPQFPKIKPRDCPELDVSFPTEFETE